ncbi:unnamed protein product, partial [Candidula unifasciata]
ELIDMAQLNLKYYQKMQMEFATEDVKDKDEPAKNNGDEKNGSTPHEDGKNGSATLDGDTKNDSMPPGDGKAVSTTDSEGKDGSMPQETDLAESAQDQAKAAPQE